jgi:hypothetical protein
MIHVQVVDHLLPVESQVEVNIIQKDVYEVNFLVFSFISIRICFLATATFNRTASLSNLSDSSVINSSSNLSLTNSNDSLRTQCSCSGQYDRCKKIL